MILLLLSIFAVDRFTKVAALMTSSGTLLLNPKMFFAFDESPFSLTLLSVLVAVLGWWLFIELTRKNKNRLVALSASLIVAGALSNLVDRFWYHATIDWIPFFGISVLNLADIAIMVGCTFVGLSIFQGKKI